MTTDCYVIRAVEVFFEFGCGSWFFETCKGIDGTYVLFIDSWFELEINLNPFL